MDQLQRIRNRQLARLLKHLEESGQLTPALESDMKRAYRFVFEDVEELLKKNGQDKEQENGISQD